MPNECDQFPPMMSGLLDGELDGDSTRRCSSIWPIAHGVASEYQKLARIVAASDRLRIEIPPLKCGTRSLRRHINRIGAKNGVGGVVIGVVGAGRVGRLAFHGRSMASAARQDSGRSPSRRSAHYLRFACWP